MNATLVSRCPECGRTYRAIVSEQDYISLSSSLVSPYCYDCDELEFSEWEAMQHETDVRRNEQVYGDNWKQILDLPQYEPNPFSFEGFMEDDTVENALYIMDEL